MSEWGDDVRGLKTAFVLSIILVVQSILPVTSTFADGDKHHVLFLQSYDPQNAWTREISRGFFETIDDQRGSILVSEEYMDTKRNRSDAYYDNFTTYFEQKYKDEEFSLIVTADNNAFNYVRERNRSFFGNTPVVFVGLNPTSDNINLPDRYSGVYEYVDVDATLKIISAIHPNDSKILIVTDETVTGQAVLGNVKDAVKSFQGKQEIEFFMSSNIDAIDTKLDGLDKYDAVLMILYNVDDQGIHYSYNEGLDEIYKRSPAPIYGMWKFYLGQGIVGGYLTDSYEHGKAAASQVVSKLQGKSIGENGLIEVQPELYFDYIELKRYGLESISIPNEAVVINRPTDTLRELAPLLLGVAITTALITMIIALWYLNRKEHMMNEMLESEKDRLSSLVDEDLNKLVVERTNDLTLANKQCEVLKEEHKRLQFESDTLKNQLHACKQDMNKLAFQSEGFIERMIQLDMSLRMYNIYLKGHMKVSIQMKEAMSELQINGDRLKKMIELYDSDALKRADLESYLKNGINAIEKLGKRLEKLYKDSHQMVDGEVYTVMSRAKILSTVEILESACSLAMVENSNRLIELSTDIESDLSDVSSASYLTYLILQLVSNCLYHAFDNLGIGKIQVLATQSEGKIIIEVSDNGIGMSEHEVENAFAPFYTTKSDQGRLGIGLGNVKQIVEEIFEGYVELTSNSNEGTRVFIEIPTMEANHE